MSRLRHSIVTTLVFVSAAAGAQTPDFAQMFGAREAVSNLQLSPDGTRISYLTPTKDGGAALIVTDVATGKSQLVLSSTDSLMRLSGCFWAKVDRLVCYVQGISDLGDVDIGYSRIVSVDAAGDNVQVLGQRTNSRTIGINQFSGSIISVLADHPDEVLMQMEVLPENTLGTRLSKSAEGLGASRVDVRTAKQRRAEPPRREASELFADAQGDVRVMAKVDENASGRIGRRLQYFYRAKGGDEWRRLGTADLGAHLSLEIDGFDEAGDWVYALMPKDGRQALYRLAVDGSGRQELVYAHPKVDVSGVLRVGKHNRPVAAEYVVDGTEFEFFDPVLAKLAASLSKALAGKPVTVLDESWDGAKKLIYVGTDLEPGRYYLYDSETRELNELLPARPDLENTKLSPMQTVSYPARDGTPIPAYLTLPPTGAAKNLPAIVMPHGGPSARDQWGFDWLSQYYAQLGYAVLQANYRGSSGYGEAWFQKNGVRSWETAIGDVNDGARWLIAQGIADPKRMAIVGWSYGGYAALQGSAVDPDLYKAAVAIAPVADWELLKTDAYRFTNYLLVAGFIGSGPHLEAGSPARHAARIKAPVLLFHGDRDLNVDINQSRRMKAALDSAGKPTELIVYKDLEHSLVDSEARADMLRRSASFLGQHLGR